MIRHVVLDTETTGISAQGGHRIIEIACIELINRQASGEHFHVYINPDRDVDEGAFRVHGISTEFLKDKPRFSEIVDSFLQFIQGSELVIHNAAFDVSFIEAELARLGNLHTISHYARIIDTLVLARKKHKGARNNLDALCKRYHIDNTHRTYHGALLDADLLARVYLAMTGGQIDLFGGSETGQQDLQTMIAEKIPVLSSRSPVIYASEEERAAHEAFMAFLEDL